MIERGQRRVDSLELVRLGQILSGDPRLLLSEILEAMETQAEVAVSRQPTAAPG
jgi:hypothetical protein